MLQVTAGSPLSNVPDKKGLNSQIFSSSTLRSLGDQCAQPRSQIDPPRDWNAKAQEEMVGKAWIFSFRLSTAQVKEHHPKREMPL